jgi:hypothetical protein
MEIERGQNKISKQGKKEHKIDGADGNKCYNSHFNSSTLVNFI